MNEVVSPRLILIELLTKKNLCGGGGGGGLKHDVLSFVFALSLNSCFGISLKIITFIDKV